MRNKNKINKENLIKEIAKRTAFPKNTIKEIYRTLEDIVYDNLMNVDKDNSVIIKLFDGLSIEGTYIPEKEKLNNLTGKVITTKSKIKPKANFTRFYCDKLNNLQN